MCATTMKLFDHNFDWSKPRSYHNDFFWKSRLNTGSRTGSFGTVFSQANPNTVYGSIFQNNMDDSSFNNWNDSLIKTITQSRQAYGGYQVGVSAIPETACKVSLWSFLILVNTVILISIYCN